jgi:hypothetical protein
MIIRCIFIIDLTIGFLFLKSMALKYIFSYMIGYMMTSVLVQGYSLLSINEKVFEKDIEKNVEKDIEKNVEKDIEKNVEKDIEKNAEKDVEKDIEKEPEKDVEKEPEKYVENI